MAKLYQESGFIDFDRCEKLASTLNIMIGARNAGKTYGALLHFLGRAPIVFMRTAKTQIDLVFSENLSPFNSINNDTGSCYVAEKTKGSDIVRIIDDPPNGNRKLCGYCLALSQVGATRGFNLDDVEILLYDEFVRHPGESTRFADKQFTMYADIVFTLNRAREIQGRPAIQQWLLGNSDDLTNDILQELGVVNVILSMKERKENYRKLPDREISIFLLDDSPVAARLHSEGILSKIFKGTSYLDMAYANAFIHDDFSDCRPQDLHGYNPVFIWDRIAVYKHKRKDLFYIREVVQGTNFNGIPSYTGDNRGTINAREDHAWLYFCWLECLITFDSYATKARFMALFDIQKT